MDKDSYSKRNAEKITESYAHLKNIVPKAIDSTGLQLSMESKMTDGIAIVIVLLLAFSFFTIEREEGTMAFIRSVRYGGKPLGVQKIVATLSGGVIGIVLLYLQNFLMRGGGFGDVQNGYNRWKAILQVRGKLKSSIILCYSLLEKWLQCSLCR